MNGNISKDGIAKDMAWMKAVGIGGLQNFDANLVTPQVVDKRLVYMTPEWKDAFRFAAHEADRQGLELAIAASPGWSETGGPWVKPEDGLKKLVWSETLAPAGKRLSLRLAAPPAGTGIYQDLKAEPGVETLLGGEHKEPPQHYGDVMVLAVPAPVLASAPARVMLEDGKVLDLASLSDGSLTTGVEIPRGGPGKSSSVIVAYDAPQTVRSITFLVPGGAGMFSSTSLGAALEASDDGKAWRKVADLPIYAVPTTKSFAPVTARQFRLVLTPLAPRMSNADSGAEGVAVDMGAVFAGSAGARPFRLVDLRLSAEPAIDAFQPKAGFALVQDYYALGTPGDGARGPDASQVVNLTGLVQPDGSLNWNAPKLPKGQQWRILRLGYSLLGTTNHPAPPEATGLEVDKFDGDAVRRYMEHYIGMYRDAAGPEMVGARGVQAILTDSIEVGAANWTPLMVEKFKALRGYDPTPWLPTLAGVLIGSREDSDRFLYDYRRTLADLMASEHYGTVAKVAHDAGLKVYGEALEDHRPSLGDDMTMRSHADVPMAALWTYNRNSGPRPSYIADMKGAASVAHIYGQNLVAAESMTAMMSPWAYAPRDLRHVIDTEFVTGVNRPVVHTSVHVPVDDKKPGLSLFIFGQYFNRQESWADMAKPWVDYLARNALLLQQGRNVADVGYFYGEEAPLTGLYGDAPVADAPRTHAYDFVSADALTRALRNEGDEIVATGGARYRALYLGGSSRKMTLATLEKIAALVDGGATVIGQRPEGSPSRTDDPARYSALVARLWTGAPVSAVGKGRVIASSDVETALAGIGVKPDFTYTGGTESSDIPFLHRTTGEGDSWFIVNRKDRPETIEARFRITGKAPELWHADSGLREPVSYRIEGGYTIVPISLEAEGSVHVVFRKPAATPAWTMAKAAPSAVATLSGPWTVAFQPGRGAPASAVLPSLAGLETHADPGIRYFSGIATYSRSFAAPKGWKPGRPLWLDLGDVRELAEVSLNGKSLGTVWHAPYRVDLAPALRKGKNELSVRVANLWVNRLIGDAQPGAKPITWTAMPTYKPSAPLRPSGLMGPVTLLAD